MRRHIGTQEAGYGEQTVRLSTHAGEYMRTGEQQVTAKVQRGHGVDGTVESDFLEQRRRDQTRALQSNGGMNHKRKVKENVATTTTGEA